MKSKRYTIQFFLLGAVLLQAISGAGQTVTAISAGYTVSMFVESDGSLWGMGVDQYGVLGNGTYNSTNRPELIVPSNVTTVAAGGGHTLFVKKDGSLWGMGYNGSGELGDGTTDGGNYYTNLPEQIMAGGVTAVAVGKYFSLFLKNDGSLWAMGANSYGQLGDDSYYPTNRPMKVMDSNVVAIAAGDQHSLFLESDGSLWGMGYSPYGQLGNANYGNAEYAYTTNMPERIVASNVTAIAAGEFHSLFIESDGSLWAMGLNNRGQLGNGTTNNAVGPEQIVPGGVVAVCGGATHSLFIESDGSLWGMGDNSAGELGDGTTNSTKRPEMIVPSGLTAISASSSESLFLRNDGGLWGMGVNGTGTLGLGPVIQTNSPALIVGGSGLPPGYDLLSGALLIGGNVRLSFVGLAGTNYELDRSLSLEPANWVPQATNSAGAGGVLVFTNTPDPGLNNFWRIRSVP